MLLIDYIKLAIADRRRGGIVGIAEQGAGKITLNFIVGDLADIDMPAGAPFINGLRAAVIKIGSHHATDR